MTPAPAQSSRLLRPTDDGGLILRLWVLGCLAGIAMGDWGPHYLIQIAAGAAIWFGAVATVDLADMRRKACFICVVVALLFTPFWVLSQGSVHNMTQSMYGHPGYPAQRGVATYLHDHTTPNDTMYVAFDQAGIYYLADRKSAYHHLYDQDLESIPTSYTEIISIIQSPNRPKYIVGTLHPGPFPDNSTMSWQAVAPYSVVEAMIDGVPIYRAKEISDLPRH